MRLLPIPTLRHGGRGWWVKDCFLIRTGTLLSAPMSSDHVTARQGRHPLNPETGKPWLRNFPLITVRDLVNVHEILRNHLGIKGIHSIIGASIGGYQALEYTIMFPGLSSGLFFWHQVQNKHPGPLPSANR